MKHLGGKIAALTGAASGIGRALAFRLAREGCHLALADIDGDGLALTAARLGAAGRVSTHVIDVARREAVQQFAREAEAAHGGVDLVINNAGVALADLLETVPLEDFEWLMGVNFWGVVYGTMAFLPLLRRRPEGHVVNVSSIYGILPTPNNGVYCAAKFAVRGYTETLAQELRGTSIRVSGVYPGGIRTNIARSARFNRALHGMTRESVAALYEKKFFRTTAEEAAEIIVAGIREDQRRILVGQDAKIMDLAVRVSPVGFVDWAGRLADRVTRAWAERQNNKK